MVKGYYGEVVRPGDGGRVAQLQRLHEEPGGQVQQQRVSQLVPILDLCVF